MKKIMFTLTKLNVYYISYIHHVYCIIYNYTHETTSTMYIHSLHTGIEC